MRRRWKLFMKMRKNIRACSVPIVNSNGHSKLWPLLCGNGHSVKWPFCLTEHWKNAEKQPGNHWFMIFPEF